jgi:nucleoside-diphosphate-sugar epimerase
MLNNERFLVTGATGFIGGWLVESIFLMGCNDVRAGIRSWSSAARLGRFPFEVVLCDVMDKDQIAKAMAGANYVIHCAIGSKKVIIQGTENMLEVALRQGVERFVHLSTTEVYGNACGEIDEKFPYHYTGQEYGDAKIEAEKLCWAYLAKGLPITVVRPPLVYGPFSKDWTVLLASKLQSGNWGIFQGHGEGFCNLVYIADLVSGILLAVQHQNAAGEVFNLNGLETITWNQYFQRFNMALGLADLKVIDSASSKLRSVMIEPLRASSKWALKYLEPTLRKMCQRFRPIKALMQYAEKSIRTTPQLDELNLYNRRALYLTKKAKDMLGYRPQYDVNTGLQMTVLWLDHLGLVNPHIR